MPEITEYKISDLTTATQVDEGDFVELSQADTSVSGGKKSTKATILSVANEIVSGIEYSSALQTTDKTIVGAINEAAQSGGGGSDVEVTPILTEGTKLATITVDEDDVDIYGENTKEELEKMSTEKTVTGNPVTLETINGGMAKSLTLTMNPIQDLHGYDYPWAGGNGKNIAKPYSYSITQDGVTVSYNNDDTVTLSGTATNSRALPSLSTATTIGAYKTLKAGTYTVSLSGTHANDVKVHVISDSVLATDNGTFTLAEDTDIYWRIRYLVNEVYSGDVKVQIEQGSTATEWTPYSNICPISGRDSVDVVISDGETEVTKTITFPSTVYGGTDEVVSGTGVSNMGMVDLASLNWSYSTTDERWLVTNPDMKNYTSKSGNILFEKYTTDVNATKGDEGKGYVSRQYIIIYSQNSTTPPTGNACYELATPTTFSTTPTPIPLNKGTNNISTDADDISLTYSEMMGIDDVKALIDAAIDYSTEEAEVPNFTFFGEKVYVKAFTFSNVSIGGAIALMTAPSYIGHIVKAWMYTTNEGGVEFTSFPAVWIHEGSLYINPYYNSTAVTGKIVLYYTKTS